MSELVQCSAKMEPELLAAIDACAQANGVSRSDAMRLMLRASIIGGDATRAFQAGYQQGLRLGGQQILNVIGVSLTRASELLAALNDATQRAASIGCIPALAAYQQQSGYAPPTVPPGPF